MTDVIIIDETARLVITWTFISYNYVTTTTEAYLTQYRCSLMLCSNSKLWHSCSLPPQQYSQIAVWLQASPSSRLVCRFLLHWGEAWLWGKTIPQTNFRSHEKQIEVTFCPPLLIWFDQQIHQIWRYSYLPLSFSKTLRIPTSSFCRHP